MSRRRGPWQQEDRTLRQELRDLLRASGYDILPWTGIFLGIVAAVTGVALMYWVVGRVPSATDIPARNQWQRAVWYWFDAQYSPVVATGPEGVILAKQGPIDQHGPALEVVRLVPPLLYFAAGAIATGAKTNLKNSFTDMVYGGSVGLGTVAVSVPAMFAFSYVSNAWNEDVVIGLGVLAPVRVAVIAIGCGFLGGVLVWLGKEL